MQRPNREMRRRMKKKGGKGQMIRQMQMKGGKPIAKNKVRTPPRPLTKEEILFKIRWLEYQRMELPKYPNIHIVRRFDAITGAIQIYYKKLENLKNPPKPQGKKK